MRIYLWSNFAKASNETKQPDLEHPTKTTNCELKQITSYGNPVFTIASESYPTYVYAYIAEMNRYYFVKGTKQGNRHMFDLECELDPLATCKTDIGSYTCYIERTSDSSYYNTDIADSALSVEDLVEHEAKAVTPIFSDTSGTYVARIVGKDVSGVATYVFQSLSEIGQIFNPVYAQYFQSGDWSSLHIGDFVQAFLCDPSKYLIGAYYSPLGSGAYTGHTTSETINVGFYPTNVAGARITTPKFDVGPITLNKPTSIYSDFRKTDAAFSSYSMYLPAVGNVTLSPDIMDEALSIKCCIDLLVGDIFYELYAGTSLVGTYQGNCYASLQLAKGDASGGASFISGALQTAGAVAAGSALAVPSAIETVKSAMTPTPSINGSQAGVSALRALPDIVVSVMQKSSGEFPVNQVGRPCCKNLQISNLSGYVKCGNPSISLAVESDIRDKVNSLLASGFYYT